MTACSELAATLNSNYLNTSPFNYSTSALPDYLNSHGVLLTKCWPFPRCTILPYETHVSASWVNADLGFHQLLPSVSHVGLVLDPKAVDITCVYPTDSASSGRDDNGCGPPFEDIERGSRGAKRLGPLGRFMAKRQMQSFKELNFGRHTPWTDISCDVFLDYAFSFGTAIGWSLQDDGSLHFAPQLALMQEQKQAIMGHEVCHISDPDPHFTPSSWLLYAGADSWTVPEQWQDAMDLQRQLKRMGPIMWNEVDLKLPNQMADIVLAVVYFVPEQEDPIMDEKKVHALAKQEAQVLGNKPLLKVDLTTNKQFVCVDDVGAVRSETRDLLRHEQQRA